VRRLPELLLAAALALPAAAHRGDGAHEPAGRLPFEPPAAGSYRLPPIQRAPDGEVLDLRGRPRALAALTRGRITLLGLVYTRCADPDACPRATWAFSAVRARLLEDPALASRVRLVTLSFDPAHDTPAVMARYAARVRAPQGAEWRFVTTRSARALAPILEGFGQDLRVAAGSRAVPGTEEFTHTLKVFLIDRDGRVREIYSTAYLFPEMILNDMRTLAMEW
jgi:cytochrome oxidase Cu insertion factor (SCO1/SenC/PrrC family)